MRIPQAQSIPSHVPVPEGCKRNACGGDRSGAGRLGHPRSSKFISRDCKLWLETLEGGMAEMPL